MSAPTTRSETTDRSDVRKVQGGSFFSRHSFGTVVGITPHQVTVRNAEGKEWNIDRELVAHEFSFADQFEAQEEVSRTKAIEILTQNSHTAMTVNFNKKPDPKDVAGQLENGQQLLTDREWLKRVTSAMDGEERTMVGYHTNGFDEHRRLNFFEAGVGKRLVDPRTINWLIVNRIKYTVK